MTTYIKHSKIKLKNGKYRVLYCKPNKSILYIKYKNSMIPYSVYRKKYMVGGSISAFDKIILEEDDTEIKIADHFEAKVQTKLAEFSSTGYVSPKPMKTTEYEFDEGKYKIKENRESLQLSFNTENKSLYDHTMNILQKKLKDIKKQCVKKLDPIQIFASKNSENKYEGFILCQKSYALHINLMHNDDIHIIYFEMKHIQYISASIHLMETFTNINPLNSWQQIYSDDVQEAMKDAVRDAFLERPVGNTKPYVYPNTSKKTKSSKTTKKSLLRNLDPYMMEIIFGYAHKSDNKLTNRQLSDLLYVKYAF